MNKKLFVRSFLITNLIVGFLFFYYNSKINRDNENFKSIIPTIAPDELTNDSNYVVCVISYGCSGRSKFMPELKTNASIIKEKGYNLYIVNDSEYSLSAEEEIINLSKTYNLTDQIFFIDPLRYPKNGGLLYAKKRYYDFIVDLTNETKNLDLGYAYYVVFKNNELLYDDYSLKSELL